MAVRGSGRGGGFKKPPSDGNRPIDPQKPRRRRRNRVQTDHNFNRQNKSNKPDHIRQSPPPPPRKNKVRVPAPYARRVGRNTGVRLTGPPDEPRSKQPKTPAKEPPKPARREIPKTIPIPQTIPKPPTPPLPQGRPPVPKPIPQNRPPQTPPQKAPPARSLPRQPPSPPSIGKPPPQRPRPLPTLPRPITPVAPPREKSLQTPPRHFPPAKPIPAEPKQTPLSATGPIIDPKKPGTGSGKTGGSGTRSLSTRSYLPLRPFWGQHGTCIRYPVGREFSTTCHDKLFGIFDIPVFLRRFMGDKTVPAAPAPAAAAKVVSKSPALAQPPPSKPLPPPFRVHPLIKLSRWTLLGLGIMYGMNRRTHLMAKEVLIREEERKKKEVRDAHIAAERQKASDRDIDMLSKMLK